MILAAVARPTPHVGRIAAWSILLSFLFAAFGFYWWSTAAIRRHYGSVRVSREEKTRMEEHPMIRLLRIAPGVAAVWCFSTHRTSLRGDLYVGCGVLVTMLTRILDATNPVSRRIVWGLGLIILFGAGPFLVRIDQAAPLAILAGGIWLALSIFDFMLLRRIPDHRFLTPAQVYHVSAVTRGFLFSAVGEGQLWRKGLSLRRAATAP
jgi:hypothetical protein